MAIPDASLVRQVRDAGQALRESRGRLLDPLKITLTENSVQQFASMAERLDRLATALERPEGM